MNETTAKSGQLPNRRRMSSKRVLKMVRVGGGGGGETSMETKEKADKKRTKVKRLLQVITSQLTPPSSLPIWNLGGFTRLIKPTRHNLISM